jgi:hypothetical protein
MRHVMLAMTVAPTVMMGQSLPATRKTPPADVGPGRIAWFDLTTTSLPRSREFYGKLFDWQFRAIALRKAGTVRRSFRTSQRGSVPPV